MSNFEYLMQLNKRAGRTFNDLTQYPVFPHVIADYRSKELKLSSPDTFRNLALPMGAQSAERRQRFQEKYEQVSICVLSVEHIMQVYMSSLLNG